MNTLPEMLKQGDKARLFPVLADTSREGRMASIFLAALPMVPSLAEEVLGTAGFRVGKRTRMETYTEVVLKNGPTTNDRPDGLIIAKNPKSSWSALVEAKVGKAELQPEQVERYLELAKANDIDAVVTISNQFVARADQSPVPVSKKLTKKVGLYHWSWTWLRTQCEILHYQQSVEDQEQKFIVSEFHRLLQHPGTGIERFTQMGQNWKEIVQSVTNKEHLKKSSPDVEDAVACWFSETRDLSLQLSRYIGKPVKERIERKFQSDGAARLKQGSPIWLRRIR
ncbi:hypothetical protein [Fodinicurvata halophila]|uniref:hypothetical protein n=1 Tax=Fodinicurvata halophila TaxID=1419723 RepID=UPI0036390135